MRHYELMVILDPDLEERTVAPSLDQFLGVVRQGGGSVEKVDIWGRRRLAYEIDKRTEGIYAVVDLTAEPATVKELDRQLNLNESVLRTKVLAKYIARETTPPDIPALRAHLQNRSLEDAYQSWLASHPKPLTQRWLDYVRDLLRRRT